MTPVLTLSWAVPLAATLLAVTSGACGRGGCPAVDAPAPSAAQAVLLDPSAEGFQRVPPPVYRVELETTQGVVLIEVESACATAFSTGRRSTA